ncbi:MAG: AI-2E family transporter [Nitriliruptor sp.]|nr:MAG: AI-2E family transporter [Nitriliruptor sp.]
MATEDDHASDPSSGADDLGATGDHVDDAVVDGPATTRSKDAGDRGPAATDADEVVVERGGDQRVPTWLDTSVQYTWRGIVLLAGLALLIVAMTRLYLVTLPVIIALILSTLCVPPARRLERAGWPKIAAAGLVVVGGVGSFFGIITLMTPAFVSQIQELGPTVAEGFNQLVLWLEEGPIGYDREQLDELLATAVDAVSGAAGTIAAQVGTLAFAIVEGFTALALALVLLFFFVKDGEQLVAWFLRLTPSAHRDDIRAAGQRGWVALSGFVRGTSLVALIDAVGIGIGLLILDVPLVLPLSVLVFFGGFVPVIGAFVTGLLAVLVALADQGLQTAIIMALIVLAVQQIESNLLQPTIMKRAVSLHPVVILGVLTAGAVLIGIVGAFLAVPVTAVLAAVGNELRIRHELRSKGHRLGPTPAGGPGVDPETLKAQFPEETQLRAAARRGDAADAEGPARRRSGRRRIRVKVDDEGETVARTTGGTVSATPDDGARSTDDPDPAGTRTEGS